MKFPIFPLAITINLIYLLLLSFAQGGIPEMELNWRHTSEETVFTFRKVQRIRDSLKFEIEAHNKHSEAYGCFYVSSSAGNPHIDDELANAYHGVATVAIQNKSEKDIYHNNTRTQTGCEFGQPPFGSLCKSYTAKMEL
jgi:hypothetical protein